MKQVTDEGVRLSDPRLGIFSENVLLGQAVRLPAESGPSPCMSRDLEN